MQHRNLQLAWRAITFVSISLLWFGLSAVLMHLSLNGLYAPETSLQTTVTWYGFLFQVCLFWLSLIAAGVGLAHVTVTRQWYHSLRNIISLWQGVVSQQWQMVSFILVLSYTALAFMVYVVQKNMGLDGQLLLAVTSAALVMFSREISQKALYIVARVAPDSRI
ncbi:hypothetical protein [Alkanindiges illinoisensis]|uniref:DUF2975 domain-containing protein n=1 Tax=Alkanindiges illinoisensis TaxID=197183 RepID=A0A4Y7XCX1_9GAMM|nr:hypothetical protein [Alkanindiges illinoisensis]TEU27836.1 hypothetical protein E2B99_06360 [Alkanindiges illinoisensis]